LETPLSVAAASRTVIESGVALACGERHLAGALVDLLDVGQGIVRQLPADALVVGQFALFDPLEHEFLDDSMRPDKAIHVALVLADHRPAELLESIELATIEALVADLAEDSPRVIERSHSRTPDGDAALSMQRCNDPSPGQKMLRVTAPW
jgi:hypothetical protein